MGMMRRFLPDRKMWTNVIFKPSARERRPVRKLPKYDRFFLFIPHNQAKVRKKTSGVKINRRDYSGLGTVKENLLPFPSSLCTKILPPFFSTNSLQRMSPSPVPFSLAVPRVV